MICLLANLFFQCFPSSIGKELIHVVNFFCGFVAEMISEKELKKRINFINWLKRYTQFCIVRQVTLVIQVVPIYGATLLTSGSFFCRMS